MIASGMLIAGDDIPVPYDRFRHRIMFPIADAKGRVIAFGGRALDPDAPAKYLNSPETPLFHKGAVLFNAHRARGAAHDKSQIIVVEGYMDVIALSEAGFPQTVAPLGTALTEDQLKLLWRMAPEPTLCFDGDAAGRRAAFRAVETALPHLQPGHSIQFAFLPEGSTPTISCVSRAQAPSRTFWKARTRPLFDVLIEREERTDQPGVTPEQRAALEARLKALVFPHCRPRRARPVRAGAAADAVRKEPQAGPGADPNRRAARAAIRRQTARQHPARLARARARQRAHPARRTAARSPGHDRAGQDQ